MICKEGETHSSPLEAVNQDADWARLKLSKVGLGERSMTAFCSALIAANNDRIHKKSNEDLRVKFLAELSGGGVPEDISARATNELLRASDHLLDANRQPDFQKTVNLFAEVWANAYHMGKIKTTPPSSQGGTPSNRVDGLSLTMAHTDVHGQDVFDVMLSQASTEN